MRIVPLAFLLLSYAATAQNNSVAEVGAWSRLATPVWAVPKTLNIPSPDGKKRISVLPINKPDSDAATIVTVYAFDKAFHTRIGEKVDAEVLWSPDSEAFLVTYSDGGGAGTYHAKVVYVRPTGLQYIEPVPNGRKLFAPHCFEPEYPNVGGFGWLGTDSGHILIAIEVPPHSSCASMGTFRAYEIAVPSGDVIAQYDQIEAKTRFAGQMGNWLRSADDTCVQKPERCIPKGLKPE